LPQDNELQAWSSKRKGIYDDILTNAANRKVKKIRTIAPRDEDIEYDLLNSNPLQDFNSGDDVGFAIPSNETQLNDDFSQTIQEIDKNLEQNDNDNDSATLSPRNNPTISQGTRTSPSKIQEQTQREKEKFYRKKKVSINSSKQKIDKNTNLFESIKDLNKMDSYIDVMKLNIQRIVTHCKTSNTVITLYKFKQNVELEMNIQRETMQKIKSLVEVYEQMNLHLDKKITSIQTSHKKYVFDLISDEETMSQILMSNRVTYLIYCAQRTNLIRQIEHRIYRTQYYKVVLYYSKVSWIYKDRYSTGGYIYMISYWIFRLL